MITTLSPLYDYIPYRPPFPTAASPAFRAAISNRESFLRKVFRGQPQRAEYYPVEGGGDTKERRNDFFLVTTRLASLLITTDLLVDKRGLTTRAASIQNTTATKLFPPKQTAKNRL